MKREINKDISDFRYSIIDNYKNSVRLISNRLKEFDKKIEDFLKRNDKNLKENEAKFETKFESLAKNLNDKYNEQTKEIENIKKIKDELLNEINNVKSYLEKIKSLNYNDNDNKNNNVNSCRNKKNIQSNDNNNFDFQAISTSNKKYDMFTNELMKNSNFNNINILDNYQNSGLKHNIALSSNKTIHHNVLDESKSCENLQENRYFIIMNKKKELSLDHYEIEKKEFDQYFNRTNKDLRRNNYSISNISNIKIKKVILPQYASKRNINRTSNSLLSENKGTIYISNDLSSNIHQKNMYFNDNSNSAGKDIFNISKINKQKLKKHRNRNRNLFHSARPINRTVEAINPKKINSLLLIKPNSKNNIFKNLSLFKKKRKYNISFEKKKNKNSKDEQSQIGFRKTINLTNKFKELILMNQKNFKKNRKIEI